MPRSCVAYGCTNSSAKLSCREKNISFHRFPLKDTSRLLEWILQIKRKNFIPNEHSVLCSEHFSEDNFEYIGCGTKKALKKDAVPDKFVYTRTKSKRKRTSYESGSPLTSEPIVCHVRKETYDKSVQTEKGIIDALIAEINYLKEENDELYQILGSSENHQTCPQDLANKGSVPLEHKLCHLRNGSFDTSIKTDNCVQTEMDIIDILEAEIKKIKEQNIKLLQRLES